jgi:sugar/nucleoside kinase (ribokinase family)
MMIDLAKLQTGLPLYAGGLVGDDDHGRYLLGELERSGIDARHMTVTDRAATSYTDVMTETHGGARTFFHYRGACALLGPEHFEPVEVPARIFHLGYLLLDRMDEPDPGYGRQAAREGLQDLGRRGLGAGQPFP